MCGEHVIEQVLGEKMVLYFSGGISSDQGIKKYDLTIPGYLNKRQLQRHISFSNALIELQYYSLPWRSDNHRDNRQVYSVQFKPQG